MLALVVHEPRVLLEDVVLLRLSGVLEFEHRLWVEQVVLSIAPPLILAAVLQVGLAHRTRRVRLAMASQHLVGNHIETYSANPGGGACEVPVHKILVQADRLEDLRTPVALQGGDAHLGHDLQHALVHGFDVAGDGGSMVDVAQFLVADHAVERLEGEVRIHSRSTVADEHTAVMGLARVPSLDDQTGPGTLALSDKVVMHPGGCQ